MNLRQGLRLILNAAGSNADADDESKKLSDLVGEAVDAINALTRMRETDSAIHLKKDQAIQALKSERARLRRKIKELSSENWKLNSDAGLEESYSMANGTLKYHLKKISSELSPMARLALDQIFELSEAWHKES